MEITSSAATEVQAQSMAKSTFDAQVVTKTLDYMNNSNSGDTGSDYQFQTQVLEAAMTGSIINELV